jgi:2'-5' RNA ligase
VAAKRESRDNSKYQVLNHRRRTVKVSPTSDGYSSIMMRLFIAIAVPPNVRRKIACAQDQLRRHSSSGAICWSRPEQFHATLKFLGDVSPDRIETLEKSVSHICNGCPALKLAAHGIGFFPSAQKPSVIWVGTNDDSGQLAELHRLLEEAVRPFTPKVKAEKFTGHITLGRFEQGHHSAIKNLLKCATALRQRHFGDWVARKVKIVRSELTSAGVIYTPLTSFSLAK